MKDLVKVLLYGSLFAIPFLTLYVENDFFFPFITGKNFGFRILVEIAFASWVVLALYDKTYRPKFSWVLAAFGALIVIMFFANLFGEYAPKSFWSNFERMDGYVTLVHVFLFFITAGSALKTKVHWKWFLHTSLLAAFLVGLYGLGQYSGVIEGRSRIDSRLGNAAYMAIYMLFHIFIALWFLVESKTNTHRAVYGLLVVMFGFLLVGTATRGTAVGLIVGLAVMATYIGLFGAHFKQFRRVSIGLVFFLVLGVGGLFAGKESDFVQNNNHLRRIANISVDDLTVRFTIWGMAYEGVKERPLLGWGQGNFNYVFNEQYNPALYAQEQWFDRVHNILFDWLIAGGILGTIAYFSIFFACLYYLFVRPLFMKDETFDVLERGVLIGLLAGYLTHNLVVFDNIVSYMFFGMILGFIHYRVGREIPAVMKPTIDRRLVSQIATPVAMAAVVATIYFVHAPGIGVAGDIIDALRTNDPVERLEYYDKALNRDSFANQEVVEQLAQQAINISRNQNIPQDVREAYIQRTELEALRMIEEKPGDARLHVFLGSFYRSMGTQEALVAAREQFKIARQLSPNKQSIITQQASIEYGFEDYEAGLEFFKEAYELDTNNKEAQELYAAGQFYVGNIEAGRALLETSEMKRRAAQNDFVVSAVSRAGDTVFLAELFEVRTEQEPANPQNWATLAYLYYQIDQPERSIETLNAAASVLPDFAPTAQCFIANIEAGNNPQEGC